MSWRQNRGVHWRNYERSQPRFFQLALARAEEYYPELVDHYREAPAAIEVTFGSRVSALTPRFLDSEAVNLFGWGYCTLLALALHDRYGYELVLLTKEAATSSGEWRGHALVELEPGRYLDITGAHEGLEEIYEEYGFRAEPEHLSREAFCERVIHEDKLTEPFEFIDELERLLTFDFAEHLNELYGASKNR